MELGRENPHNYHEDFCMTVLGLKMARRVNAVSSLHGEVSRNMWTGLYPGKPEDDIPSATSRMACTCLPGSRRKVPAL